MIDCMTSEALKICEPDFVRKGLNNLVTSELICELGGISIRNNLVEDAPCSRNATNCTDGYYKMWKDNKTDPGLGRLV
jgi:hypothetical protein